MHQTDTQNNGLVHDASNMQAVWAEILGYPWKWKKKSKTVEQWNQFYYYIYPSTRTVKNEDNM